MADTKISNLAALAAAPDENDVFALVDTSASSTKKLEARNLVVATAGAVANVTDGGTIALGGFTATIPATGTVALLATANVFTEAQTVSGTGGVAGLLDVFTLSNDREYGVSEFNGPSMRFLGTLGIQFGSLGAGSKGYTGVEGFMSFGVLFDSVLTEAMRIQDNHLLIGTSTDGGKLTVNGEIALVDGMDEPGTTSGWAKLYVDDDGGDLKIKFGNGTVKTIVVDE